MRLSDQRSKQSHPIEPFAAAFAGKGAQCVTDPDRRHRARTGVRRAGVGAPWSCRHALVVTSRGTARILVWRACEQQSESSFCHRHDLSSSYLSSGSRFHAIEPAEIWPTFTTEMFQGRCIRLRLKPSPLSWPYLIGFTKVVVKIPADSAHGGQRRTQLT